MAKLIAVQINGTTELERNIKIISSVMSEACDSQDDKLVVLPECATKFGCKGQQMLDSAEVLDSGRAQSYFSELAVQHACYLVAGSMPIKATHTKDSEANSKYFAASLVYAPDGERIGCYNKIHLFDVEIEDRTGAYTESKYTAHGTKLNKIQLPWAELGQSICYDLRFPSLYAAMNYPDIIAVPSAFTKHTGQAHWHALLKARAIENQAYIVAANQWGQHEDGRETYGNSCIYSPWGECLDLVESGDAFAIADFDSKLIEKIRRSMPVSTHRLDFYE